MTNTAAIATKLNVLEVPTKAVKIGTNILYKIPQGAVMMRTIESPGKWMVQLINSRGQVIKDLDGTTEFELGQAQNDIFDLANPEDINEWLNSDEITSSEKADLEEYLLQFAN
jgi:hypothetical protein